MEKDPKKIGSSSEDGLKRIDIPITGMSCASCAVNIERGLNGIEGVGSANVNFATSRATVLFDPHLANPEDLVRTIRESGYDVAAASTDIAVEGMSCASCVARIEKALLASPGVLKAAVNLATARAHIEYLPNETNRRDLAKVIESAGYKVIETGAGPAAEDAERFLREKEYKTLRTKVIAGAAFGVVIFLGSMRHWFPWVPSFLQNFYVLWALATPVQFVLGLQFYRGAWGGSATGPPI